MTSFSAWHALQRKKQQVGEGGCVSSLREPNQKALSAGASQGNPTSCVPFGGPGPKESETGAFGLNDRPREPPMFGRLSAAKEPLKKLPGCELRRVKQSPC